VAASSTGSSASVDADRPATGSGVGGPAGGGPGTGGLASGGRGDAPSPDWRILPDDGERSPALNLAIEEAIGACHHGTPTLRLWRNERCVVLGRAQVAEGEADLAYCHAAGIPVLRRHTGGGAVFHDPGNLNVSVFLARDGDPVRVAMERGLTGLYQLVLGPLADAIRSLAGESATRVMADERAVWIGEGKVSGVAAWLGARTVLVHATLLVASDLDLLGHTLAGPGAPGNARWEHTKSRRVRVTSLAREGLPTGSAAVDSAVVAAFTGGKGAAAATASTDVSLTDEERARAAVLLGERYSQATWHLDGRSSE
jgi:lipoate---protein ligase